MEEKDNFPKEGNKKNNWLLWVLGVALAGSVGYNIYTATQDNKYTEDISALKTQNLDVKNELQKELEDLNKEYQKLKDDNVSKETVLRDRDAEIEAKQKEIERILAKSNSTAAELKKAQSLIASLRSDITGYKTEIAELRKQNDSLAQSNVALHEAKEALTTSLNEQTTRADTNEQTMRSTFSVSNYTITGIRVRKSGKEVEKERAKRVTKLRVTFDLDPNQYAESGQNEIFVAVHKPDGSLGHFTGASSGQLKTWSQGTVDYSDRLAFDYQKGTKKTVSFDWEDNSFESGKYKIDIYQNGFKIGQETLALK